MIKYRASYYPVEIRKIDVIKETNNFITRKSFYYGGDVLREAKKCETC